MNSRSSTPPTPPDGQPQPRDLVWPREMPPGAELPAEGSSRRRFLEVMGASMAMAAGQGCIQPQEQIVPYVRQPEDLVPGKPLYFATAMPHDGSAIGLLVESHVGRPTKIEGNPLHPAVPATNPAADDNADQLAVGATDHFAQAGVLTLYDPDRSQTLLNNGHISTWDNFVTALKTEIDKLGDGAGLRILSDPVTSPTLARQRDDLLTLFPQAAWHTWNPVHGDNEIAGCRLAFGENLQPLHDVARADVIVSLDADFLVDGPGRLMDARGYASRRNLAAANRDTLMSRIYMLDTSMTLSGAAADHRLPVSPDDVLAFALQLAANFGLQVQVPNEQSGRIPAMWRKAAMQDLRRAKSDGHSSLIIAGRWQPPIVHALAAWLNSKLGNIGKTVHYVPPIDGKSPLAGESLLQLVDDMKASNVNLLIMLQGNPVATSPASAEFASLLKKVRTSVHLSEDVNETSAGCTWHIPAAHFLESWSDVRTADGTASIVQPLIAPLYGGKSTHEVIAAIAGNPQAKSHDLVRETWTQSTDDDANSNDFERKWKTSLHNGVVSDTAFENQTPTAREELASELEPILQVQIAASSAQGERTIVSLRPDPSIWDGRFANNSWLQELPRPFTKLTWDNALLISPATAKKHSVVEGDVVRMENPAGRQLDVPIFIVPGHCDATATLHLGYGRQRCGSVGRNVGVDAYSLRDDADTWFVRDVTLEKMGQRHPFATTQKHHRMDGRHLALTGTFAQFDQDREHPQFMEHVHEPGKDETFYPQRDYDSYKWGMAVNLSSCTGCNACVIACQAENNIPVVGKEEVMRSREMHWLRIDHYYEGDDQHIRSLHQPVMCQHCENAPCEVVCPVAATTHSAEGLNEMTYNRCVGTRYCANNCPYKVRRFNFFNYNAKLDGAPVLELLSNPDVSVRERGVMEKCTYCVQRINAARIDAEKQDRTMRDGDVVTACQAVCPTQAIMFGDLNDEASRANQLAASPLNYGLLADLNTRPRTMYLASIRNPHPDLVGEGDHEPND